MYESDIGKGAGVLAGIGMLMWVFSIVWFLLFIALIVWVVKKVWKGGDNPKELIIPTSPQSTVPVPP